MTHDLVVDEWSLLEGFWIRNMYIKDGLGVADIKDQMRNSTQGVRGFGGHVRVILRLRGEEDEGGPSGRVNSPTALWRERQVAGSNPSRCWWGFALLAKRK